MPLVAAHNLDICATWCIYLYMYLWCLSRSGMQLSRLWYIYASIIMHVHNTEHYRCTPPNNLDLLRNHVEFARAWAPRFLLRRTLQYVISIVDLSPMKLAVTSNWCMEKVASVQWTSHTLCAQNCYRGALGYIECSGYCFESQRYRAHHMYAKWGHVASTKRWGHGHQSSFLRQDLRIGRRTAQYLSKANTVELMLSQTGLHRSL